MTLQRTTEYVMYNCYVHGSLRVTEDVFMSPRKSHASIENSATELLRDLLIVQLGQAGVPQQEIRKIARCEMRRVSSIVRLLKSKSEETK